MIVYQIYFKEEQVMQLEKEFIPYHNETCTEYFENEVIRRLIMGGQHKITDYFGVVSYQIRQKLGYMKENWKNHPKIANTSTSEFTPQLFAEALYSIDPAPDAMSFQRHIGHDTISTADGFHPGFLKYWKHIMGKIGYNWVPETHKDVFYCNYFVAKSHIYEKYVKEMLNPAMVVMLGMPELYEKCNYPKPFPEHLKGKLSVDHWTYHTFLCERMFTYFAHIHNLNCWHY